MAFAEGTGGAGGPARYALVKARGGAVLADGDEVFDDRAAALAAFERARGLGWALHATPELAAELDAAGAEIAVLDPAVLGAAAAGEAAAIAISRAVPSSGGTFRPLHAALGAVAIVALAGVWLGRDALFALFEEAALPLAPIAAVPDPEVAVAVDGAALVAACRRALIENPPFLPAWTVERIACAARFGDAELAALRPELAGRPVLLVRWGVAAGHAEAIARRLAEQHLARWHAGAVSHGRAWAAAPLAPVLRIVDAPTPPFPAIARGYRPGLRHRRREAGLRPRQGRSVDGPDRVYRAARAARTPRGRHRRAGDHRVLTGRGELAHRRAAGGAGDGEGIEPRGARGCRRRRATGQRFDGRIGGRRWNAIP